jgi:polar amino acid transport system permease protein
MGPHQRLTGARRAPRMTYTFHFGAIWDARDELLDGALFTLWLSAASMAISMVIAIFGAAGRSFGPRWLKILIGEYVELIRNTPFLVQVTFLFFGLPALPRALDALFADLGLPQSLYLAPNAFNLDANQAALIAMVFNGTAYTIEIVRAGIESITAGQWEAAKALGLHRMQAFRLIVLPQALRVVVPPLGSQFILIMLNSSVVSAISADELMSAAQSVAGRTFFSFETYIVVFFIYLALSSLFQASFLGLEWAAFGGRAKTR